VAKRKRVQKQARLDERAAALRRQAEIDARNRNIVIAVFALLIIGGGGLLYFLANPPHFGRSTQTSTNLLGFAVASDGRDHIPNCHVVPTPGATPIAVSQPVYHHEPPSSGCHQPPPLAPVPFRVYTSANAVRPDRYIHNLEHGGVVLVYRCQGSQCDQESTTALSLYSNMPKDPLLNEIRLLVTPYQNMPPAVAVLAWQRELDLPDLSGASQQKVNDFYNQWVDKGPECSSKTCAGP